MKKGFTLVELAIVLVIIGLLVGGVLAGQELIAQAKVRKHISELQNLDRAWASFRLKYGGIPGDLRDPQRFFPPCNGTKVWSTPSLGGGNGNGMLGDTNEVACTWPQLAVSQLYNAIGPKKDSISAGTPPENIDYEASDGFFISVSPVENSALGYLMNIELAKPLYGNFYLLFSKGMTGALTVYEMRSIDDKMDDGKPAGGMVLAGSQDPAPETCTADVNQSDGFSLPAAGTVYNPTKGKYCLLLYNMR